VRVSIINKYYKRECRAAVYRVYGYGTHPLLLYFIAADYDHQWVSGRCSAHCNIVTYSIILRRHYYTGRDDGYRWWVPRYTVGRYTRDQTVEYDYGRADHFGRQNKMKLYFLFFAKKFELESQYGVYFPPKNMDYLFYLYFVWIYDTNYLICLLLMIHKSIHNALIILIIIGR